MRKLICLTILFLTPTLIAQKLPNEFQKRVMGHIEFLADLGDRVAGTPNEEKAIQYIQTQMSRAGLQVSIEPFNFQSFEVGNAILSIGNESAVVEGLAFDVYGTSSVKAEAVFLKPEIVNDTEQLLATEIDNKIAVTTGDNLMPFIITNYKRPQAAVIISAMDFERMSKKTQKSAEITLTGRNVRFRSANVVGKLESKNAEKEIILSAHHDSWLSSPGASDNASGVAVILELARYFANQKKQYPFNIKFVTFGAEEFGLLGSKAYLMEHQKDLGKCILMFNVDNLGGESLNLEMLGKVKNIPSGGRIYNQIPLDLMEKATADLRLNWKFLNPGIELNASNVPSWLQELLKETAQDLGFEIQSLHNIGSDHQVFAQAGVVATDITSTIGNIHTPEDLPERLNSENLEHAAQIIAGVVERMR